MAKVGAEQKQYIKDSIETVRILKENERIEKLNNLIDAANRNMEKIQDDRKEIEYDALTYRTVAVPRFGYWNCDQPVFPQLIPIAATFENKEGKLINPYNIAVYCQSFKAVFVNHDKYLWVMPNTDNMIVGSVNGSFAYLSYEDYAKLQINKYTGSKTFVLTVLSDEESNYENIRKIAKNF